MIQKIIFLCLTIFVYHTKVTCDSDHTSLFKFLSKKATTLQVNQGVDLSLRCFKQIRAILQEDDKAYYVYLDFHKKLKWNCVEMITLSTGKNYSIQLLFLQGSKKVKFLKQNMSNNEIRYINKHGIKLFKSCDDFKNLPKNLSILFQLFFGGLTEHKIPIIGPKVSKFMEKTVQKTLLDYTDRSVIKRKQTIDFKINKNEISSGDVVLLWRMDGFNTIIEVGSGSRAGHCTVALWKEDQLYICESKSSSYFPVNGVKCTLFDQWVKYCKDSDVNLILLPLKEQYRKKFDLDKAWNFVNSKYDNEYGFHNFFFGWIDTIDQNLPDVLDLDYLSILLHLFEKYLPNIPKKYFLDAFNKRLQTENLNLEQIWEEIYKKDTSLQELTALPEQEDWLYDGQTNYTCSSFAIAILKNAGLFDNLNINSTEFTPKDLYELEFWELNKQIDGCQNYMEDGYCQFLGHFKFQLGKTSFVKPYQHMAEKCPTIAPDYNRSENC